MKKILKRILFILLFTAVSLFAAAAAFDFHVRSSAKPYILDRGSFDDFGADYILVLGAAVRPDGSLSAMLEDRMQTGVDLFRQRASSTLLLTGDSAHPETYDETAAMERFALAEGLLPGNLVLDRSGLSTYDSVKRAQTQMTGNKVIIVTQKYHLYRAVYLARQLGLEAYGCDSALRDYGGGQLWFDLREIPARIKDVFFVKTGRPAANGTEDPFVKYNVTE